MPLSHPPILPSNICYCVKLQLDLPKSHYYIQTDLGTNPTKQQYKFGGKELITTNGLNEYDFGARNYYPAVPAFTRIDPMAEKYPWLSPYLYCANNPVNFVDPDGKETHLWTTVLPGSFGKAFASPTHCFITVTTTNNGKKVYTLFCLWIKG